MRLTVVGCGTVVPEPDRACSSYYVEHGETRALLDCGSGAVQALARLGLPWERLTHLFLTHFHADHVGSLPGLFFALRHGVHPPRISAPLEVWGPPGTRALFEGLAATLGEFFLDPGFPVSIRELVPGSEVVTGDLVVSCKDVPHTPESMALRLATTQGPALAYTGDTGPDESLANFCSDVDLLVGECSLPDDLVGDNHLSPSRLARLSQRAGARRLVATHVYPQFRHSTDVAGLISKAGYTGPVELAREGLTIDLQSRTSPSS
jgi:ribonuclease BN (tRNA processing enzyme)